MYESTLIRLASFGDPEIDCEYAHITLLCAGSYLRSLHDSHCTDRIK